MQHRECNINICSNKEWTRLCTKILKLELYCSTYQFKGFLKVTTISANYHKYFQFQGVIIYHVLAVSLHVGLAQGTGVGGTVGIVIVSIVVVVVFIVEVGIGVGVGIGVDVWQGQNVIRLSSIDSR